MSFSAVFEFYQFACKKVMTELYIDRQLVVLPENFTITIIEENPFFTKNGKYTYDISLSLLDTINAQIYKHLNRINRKGDIPKNRSAYLVVDNEVMLNGTEVILEYTEREVKIQLVSGNSELNFLIGGDRKLRDLNLGQAEKYIAKDWSDLYVKVNADMMKAYPERNWQLIPYAAGDNTDVLSDDQRYLNIGNCFSLGNAGPIVTPVYNSYVSGQVPQPYLCFIIEKIIEAIGYTLNRNVLSEHDKWKYAYIVNGIQTFEFAKMLPDWTVNEFFTEIEQFFDCTFIVDEFSRTVQLLFNYMADSDSFGETDITILDNYTNEIDNENKILKTNSNVGYSLDSYDYSSFMDLGQRIRNLANYENTVPLNELVDKTGDPQYDIIYKPKDTKAQFINYDNDGKITLKKVDSFRPWMNNTESEELDIEFNIVPAAMMYSSLKVLVEQSEFWVQFPIAGEYDSLFPDGVPATNIKKINIQTLVEEKSEVFNETIPSKIRLAFYTGLQDISAKSITSPNVSGGRYPNAFVEYLEECFQETKKERYYGRKDEDPFRLENMNRDIYSKAEYIDTTKTYKLNIINDRNFDIKSKFIAKNKKYKCVKIEKTISTKGFDKIIKGEFYPMA